jgi:uncharacterized protein YbaA (DUF1428 family)
MSELNATAIEQWIGSEVDHFIYRVPKKNHDSTVQLGKEFSDIIRSYGVAHLVFQLNNTEAPMEGITNIAKTVSTTQDEEVWLELMFYRDRKHREEVHTKMQNDETLGPLWQRSMELVSPGTSFIMGIMGEFSRSKI